jgi:hypothetical protein
MQCVCAVLYYELWPVRLHYICPHFVVNGTSFGETLRNIILVFRFSLQLLFENLLILGSIRRDIAINVKMSSRKVPVVLEEF